jgi:hypothetical protein
MVVTIALIGHSGDPSQREGVWVCERGGSFHSLVVEEVPRRVLLNQHLMAANISFHGFPPCTITTTRAE